MTLAVLYSCSACEVEGAEVPVPLREPGQDVISWFELIVLPALRADHQLRSPDCEAHALEHVLVPQVAGACLGGPVLH